MQATSLYWFAAEQQTNTLTGQKCAFLTKNLLQNLMELVFFSENNKKGQKMT